MTTVLLPAVWLRQTLKGKLTWKTVLDYLKLFLKVQVSVHRLKFSLKKSEKQSNTGLFEVKGPRERVFLDQAVQNFQLKLLRTETSRANEDRKRCEEMLMKARSLVQNKLTNSGGHPFSAS